jgi:uncharacterized protein YggE
MPIRLMCGLALLSVIPSLAQDQSGTAPRRPHITAIGEGIASGAPDQAQVDVTVVTQAASAQDAAAQNANQTSAVLAKLRQMLGSTADIKTLNYSLTPNYNYPREGGNPTLTGFIASNTLKVTVSDLTLPGKIIDTAIQTGANRVDSLRFSLKEELPLRTQALGAAAQQARNRAVAIAMGLGLRVGNVISVEENASQQIVPQAMTMAAAAGGAPTPVQPGNVEVRATVTLDIELVQ